MENTNILRRLKRKTTFIDRSNTNRKLLEEANRLTRNENTAEPFKPLREQIEAQQMKYFGHIIREAENEPTRKATFIHDMIPNIGRKQRVGRPRCNWIIAHMKKAFNITKRDLMQDHDKDQALKFKHQSPSVQSWIHYAAIWTTIKYN